MIFFTFYIAVDTVFSLFLIIFTASNIPWGSPEPTERAKRQEWTSALQWECGLGELEKISFHLTPEMPWSHHSALLGAPGGEKCH